MNIEQSIRNFPKTLLNWYTFQKGAKALFVSGGIPKLEVLFDVLEECELNITVKAQDELDKVETVFDYIVLAGIIEKSKNPNQLLAQVKTLLKLDGKLLIVADNRLAIRYFCGDKDRFTGHVLDGIDNYSKVSRKRLEEVGGHAYSKAELIKLLKESGFEKYQFYSVMPALERPHMLIADHYEPNELLDIRIFPHYQSPKTIFLEEENLYSSLLENHMFHQMANGFLIECALDGQLCGADEVTVQEDRAQSQAMATILRKGERVLKKALYKEGQKKIQLIMEYAKYLSQHQVPMVKMQNSNKCLTMPYVNGQIATEYFRELLRTDKELFLKQLCVFRDIIEHSSEAVPYEEVNWQQFEPGWKERKEDDPNLDKWEKLAFGSERDKQQIGTILKRGYIDLVTLNCFYTNDGFKFFDQEFFIENFPVNAIFIRSVDMIYNQCPQLQQIYDQDQLLKKFHLYEHRETWRRMAEEFLSELRHDKELASYHRLSRRDGTYVEANRHRMDYSQDEYEKLFEDIFKDVENKKIYLFGAGKYAKDFIKRFSDCYEIAGVLDNNSERWGDEISGIPVYGPQQLQKEKHPYKVFICIKLYEEVLEQLQNMGIKALAVYEPRVDHERPLKHEVQLEKNNPKKYHIGYVAGVFDLFHIGHLNLLKRAKEYCDYLIVGVVSDEQVVKEKKTTPYIAFEERIQIVQACQYVDEAVAIPVEEPDTEAAYRRYHFDVQFSGSDYANDPVWLAKQTFLRQRGAELMFFPYTESTSSTKLKGAIQKEHRNE